MRGRVGTNSARANARSAPARRRIPQAILAGGIALLILVMLAGCAGAQAGSQPASSPATTITVPLAGTPSPSPTIGPTPVQITDLATFRARLVSAFQSNTWAKVVPLLSPAFSFQGLNSGGASLVMPDSAHDLHDLYASGGPWTQSSQYEVNIHFCYASGTPVNQQMGFDGGSGSFILIGIGHWQGYWVIAWAFQDPLGGSDACANG